MQLIKKVVLFSTALLIIFFIGCKTKKDSIPVPVQASSNDKIKKITITGTDPQEYDFFYDKNNLLTKILAKGVGDLDTTVHIESNYTFDVNGNLLTASSSYNDPNDGNVTLILKYEYDIQNRLITIKTSENGGSFNISKKYYYSSGNTSKTTVEYSFDSSINTNQMTDSTVYYSYNSYNKPDSSKHYYIFTPSLMYNQERYTYDGFGNILKIEVKQTAIGGSWETFTEQTFDNTNQVKYPKELDYFFLGSDDSEDILDPNGGYDSFVPTQTITYTTCNSNAVSVTDNSTLEKNANGTIKRQVDLGDKLNYSTCVKSASTYEYLFYY